jgi:hypothetical protein
VLDTILVKYSIFYQLIQIRVGMEKTEVWKVVTKSMFRIILSIFSLFTLMLAMIPPFPLIFRYAPFWALIYFAVYVIINVLLYLFVSEGKRHSKGK